MRNTVQRIEKNCIARNRIRHTKIENTEMRRNINYMRDATELWQKWINNKNDRERKKYAWFFIFVFARVSASSIRVDLLRKRNDQQWIVRLANDTERTNAAVTFVVVVIWQTLLVNSMWIMLTKYNKIHVNK